MNISNNHFDNCVTEAMDKIDPQFRHYFNEVPVIIEDTPDEKVCSTMNLTDHRCLLGLFRGVPLNRRSVLSHEGPNQIVLYRKNLLAMCPDRRQLEVQIRKTLIHELAHYLGFSEEQIRQLRY